jgi:hypothetical protein
LHPTHPLPESDKIPRYDLNFKPTSASFSTDINGAGKGYLSGVALQAGGLAALATLFFLFFSLGYGLSFCCSRRCLEVGTVQ